MNIYILFGEYFIDVRPCTAQLGSKPSHRTSLFVKRFFNKMSRMNHKQALLTPPFPEGKLQYKESVGIIRVICFRGSGKPVVQDKTTPPRLTMYKLYTASMNVCIALFPVPFEIYQIPKTG